MIGSVVGSLAGFINTPKEPLPAGQFPAKIALPWRKTMPKGGRVLGLLS
ncbi:MAG: hypothetical protein N2116_00240 [Armatimonadetes bacterium]|nr:hypothetical protein [Armatimonadota bacterium]